MATYIIDAGGPWRRYHPTPVPTGWRMLGTIQADDSNVTGALGCSPAGIYVQINPGSVRLLDQRAVDQALRQIKLP